MHWGIRRYQYKDGSLTSEGRIHYGVGNKRTSKNKNVKFNESFDSWGNSKSNNVLYIDDKGNTSKSDTLVNDLKKQANTTVINLNDYRISNIYLGSDDSKKSRSDRINDMISKRNLDKDFIDILERTAPGWDSLNGATTSISMDRQIPLVNGVTTRRQILTNIGNAITDYGNQKFDSGYRVVVRGSDVLNLHSNDPDFYKNNPGCVIDDKNK